MGAGQRTGRALFLVAAFTGLRLGEMLALHWSDVNFDRRILSVSRSMSAGEESSTKSRRARSVPLADQAAPELAHLAGRVHFTSRNDYVFCRPAKLTETFESQSANLVTETIGA